MYTEQDLEDFSDSEREAKKLYMEREDTLYRKFWNQYPGSDPGFEYESFPTMLRDCRPKWKAVRNIP
ncbi:MAG: hypothetical protein ACLTAX_11495 [Waltera sp.]